MDDMPGHFADAEFERLLKDAARTCGGAQAATVAALHIQNDAVVGQRQCIAWAYAQASDANWRPQAPHGRSDPAESRVTAG
jgi:hypothetical protein